MSRPKHPLLATVEDLSWIAGHWQGTVGNDEVEEVWTRPSHGSLLGMFRWFRAGEIRVIEIITIANFEDATRMKFKHFDAALTSWEAQDETTDFVLVDAKPNLAVFLQDGRAQWIVYERTGEKLTIRFEAEEGPPSVKAPFEYNLLRPATS